MKSFTKTKTHLRACFLALSMISLASACAGEFEGEPGEVEQEQLADQSQELVVTPTLVGTISASPSNVPVVVGFLGTSRICWNSDVTNSQVYVSTNGAAETLFAEARSGCQNAPWIQIGHTYDFRLYAGRGHTTRLAAIRVAGFEYTPEEPTCGPCNGAYDCHCGDICRPVNEICP